MDTDLLTAEQVARLTGVTESYVRRLARTGQLDAVRTESGKWLIPASATDRVRRRAVPNDQAADGWQVERDLLYAERAELLLRTRDLELVAARSDIERLRADNDRLRQVVAQLSATVATMAAPDLPAGR